jgi:hypothetical protein
MRARDSGGPSSPARSAGGGEIRREHTLGPNRKRPAIAKPGDVPAPSKWPYGGDTIPIVDGFGGYLVPLLLDDGATLDPNTLHAYQVSNGVPPPDPSCALFETAGYLGANNTALSNYGSPDYNFNLNLPENEVRAAERGGGGGGGGLLGLVADSLLCAPTLLQAVAQCNATCWANASCAAWDLIKVTPSSGKTQPWCGIYSHPVGCVSDPNQWAGAKAPLPFPKPNEEGNQTWMLPLSWVGSTVTATTITPSGPVPGTPQVRAAVKCAWCGPCHPPPPDPLQVVINGRSMKLVGVAKAMPVRLVRTQPGV